MADGTGDLSKAFDAIDKRGQDIIGREQEELTPAIGEASKANAAPLPAQPKLERAPAAPKDQGLHNIGDWMSASMLVAGISGAFVRRHVTTALNSFSGFIKGVHQGNLDQAKESFTEWKAASDEARDNNEAMLKEYENALKSRSGTIEQKMNQVQLIAAKYKDMITYQAAEAKNFTLVSNLIERQRESGEKMAQSADKIDLLYQKLDLEKQKVAAGVLPDEQLNDMADQYLAGDKSVFQNIGRGTQGSQNIVKLREVIGQKMKAQGMSGSDIAAKLAEYGALTAGMRVSGTREANIGIAVNEANNMSTLALQASDRLPRGTWVPLNRAQQQYQAGTSSPELARFVAANNSLVNVYSRAVSGGTATVSGSEHAREMLSTAMSPQAYRAVVEQLQAEMLAALKSPGQVREQLKEGTVGSGGKPAAPAAPPAAPGGAGWSITPVQ